MTNHQKLIVLSVAIVSCLRVPSAQLVCSPFPASRSSRLAKGYFSAPPAPLLQEYHLFGVTLDWQYSRVAQQGRRRLTIKSTTTTMATATREENNYGINGPTTAPLFGVANFCLRWKFRRRQKLKNCLVLRNIRRKITRQTDWFFSQNGLEHNSTEKPTWFD